MNKSPQKKTKNNIDSVKGKVATNRKELEELKQQFEQLLKENIKVSQNENEKIPENDLHKNAQKSCSEPQVPQTNQPTKSPDKPKPYNVKEAREYMKKQREKRALELKTQITTKNKDIDLKKQKLRELNQKAKEIVATNVQLKRERSKSRDRDQIRLDRAAITPIRRDRSKSRDNQPIVPKPKSAQSSKQNLLNIPDDMKICTRQARQKVRESPRQSVNDEPTSVHSNITLRDKIDTPKCNSSPANENLLKPPLVQPQIAQIGSIDLNLSKTIRPHFPSITMRDKCKSTESINKLDETYQKETKETQTSQKIDKPFDVIWNKNPTALPHPYNFINAVKQKLAIYTQKYTDVGVQSSLPSTPSINQQTKDEIKELLIKSTSKKLNEENNHDYNSFASHKNLNLDLAPVEKLQLLPNNNKVAEEPVIRRLFVDDSESDTSKNIPEISSESGVSSRTSSTNSEQKNRDQLNLENIEKMTLIDSKSLQHSQSKKTSTKIDEISNRYSSDFVDEIKSSGFNTRSDSLVSTTISSATNSDNKLNRNVSDLEKEVLQSLATNSSVINKIDLTDLHKNSHIYDKIDENSNVETENDVKSSISNDIIIKNDDFKAKSLTNSLQKQNELSSIKERSQSLSINENYTPVSSNISEKLIDLKNSPKYDTFVSKSGSNIPDLNPNQNRNSIVKNFILEPTMKKSIISNNNDNNNNSNVNEIHLKFEAEVHLLNDFNESLKQLMAVEEAFDHLKTKQKNDISITKILQNIDTQTSFLSGNISSSSSTVEVTTSNNILPKTIKSLSTASESSIKNDNSSIKHSFINYSRGSGVDIEIEKLDLVTSSINNSIISLNVGDDNNETIRSDIELSNLINEESLQNVHRSSDINITNNRSHLKKHRGRDNNNINCAGLSLAMFDQLIKDEDVRLEHLKAIIKIREQALLDRTKSKLYWLDTQKKKLLETGKFEEASAIKKKQRATLIKHEQERNEIKRLQQQQNKESNERINKLKRQKNLIKSQLSTDTMLTNIKVNTTRERRHSGPMIVLQSRRTTESIHSDASSTTATETTTTTITSKPSSNHVNNNNNNNNNNSDRFSVSSQTSSILSRLQIDSSDNNSSLAGGHNDTISQLFKGPISNVTRTLLMREAALQKRKKAAEALLKWHQKLLDEEKKIAKLEVAASSLIKQTHNKNKTPAAVATTITTTSAVPVVTNEKYKFSGKQSNKLWRNMTGGDEKRFIDDKIYDMSQITLERFCKSARNQNRKKYNTSDLIKTLDRQTTDNNTSDVIVSELSDNVQDIPSISGKSIIDNDNIPQTNGDEYTTEFESESVQNDDDYEQKQTNIKQSISELIDNFSKIEDEISMLSQKSILEQQQQPNENLDIIDISSPKKSSEIIEIVDNSIIEINDSPKTNEIVDEVEVPSTLRSIHEESSKLADISEMIKDKSPEQIDDLSLKIIEDIGNSDQYQNSSEYTPIPTNNEEISDMGTNVETPKSSIDVDSFREQSINVQPSGKSDKEEEEEKSSFDIPSEKFKEKEEELSSDIPESEKVSREEEKSSIQVQSEKLNQDKEDSSIDASSEKLEEKEEQSSSDFSKSENLDKNVSSIEQLNNLEEEDKKQSTDVSKTEKLEEEEKDLSMNIETQEENEPSVDVSKSKKLNELEEPSIDVSKSEKLEEDKQSKTTKEDESKSDDTSESTTMDDNTYSEPIEVDESSTQTPKSIEIVDEIILTDGENLIGYASKQPLDDGDQYSSDFKSESEKSTNTTGNSTDVSKKSSTTTDSSPRIDVKKRVSEILADANHNSNRNDKSPRLQDIYVTTYDIPSSTSPEMLGSPEDTKITSEIFGNEAEELLRKQLAIEQEIKQIERQQKEQLPYAYMREIPNKPPPPYTPPQKAPSFISILPSDAKEIDEVTNYTSKVLYKAYQSKNLSNVKFSESSFKLISKIDIGKNCCELLFNICKELAQEHYSKFEEKSGPSWMIAPKRPQLAMSKPLNGPGLERFMNRRIKELFGFQKPQIVENAIIKWGRKKRDHVDEILVRELLEEESEWTNFDEDELIVKDQLTDEIMKILIDETAEIFLNLLTKK